jgi:hypothetical protein
MMFTITLPLGLVSSWLFLGSLAPTLGNGPNYFGYHPMSVMSLGLGHSPEDLSQARLRAIEYTEKAAEGGALSTEFAIVLVADSTQLKDALHLDLKVDASYLVFKGSNSFAYDQSALFSADAATVVISATSEYARLTMAGAHLSKEAKALISAGQMADFEQTYGSRYVVMERRGASVSVIVTITGLSIADKSKLAAGLEGSGSWGPLGAGAKLHFESELERASKAGRLNIQVVATGGEGFGGLADLVKALSANPEALKNIFEALGVYLKQFNAKNSVPIGFHTASMKDFGWKPAKEPANRWTDLTLRRLLEIVDRYRATIRNLDQIRSLLRHTDPRDVLLQAEQVAELRAAIPKYEQYLYRLAITHKMLLSGEVAADFTLPDDPLPDFQICPPLPPLPRGSLRVESDNSSLDAVRFFDLLSRQASSKDRAKMKGVFLLKGQFLERADLFLRTSALLPSNLRIPSQRLPFPSQSWTSLRASWRCGGAASPPGRASSCWWSWTASGAKSASSSRKRNGRPMNDGSLGSRFRS